MKLIKFEELRENLGNSFIAITVRNFPKRAYRYKTIGNIIYLLAKPSVKMSEMDGIRRISNGKDIRVCILPNEVIKAVGL
jgi:hypothetical protein